MARSPSRHSSRAQSDTRRARSEDDDAHEGGVAFTGDLNEDVEALEAAEVRTQSKARAGFVGASRGGMLRFQTGHHHRGVRFEAVEASTYL